jgi:hypothetical protein
MTHCFLYESVATQMREGLSAGRGRPSRLWGEGGGCRWRPSVSHLRGGMGRVRDPLRLAFGAGEGWLAEGTKKKDKSHSLRYCEKLFPIPHGNKLSTSPSTHQGFTQTAIPVPPPDSYAPYCHTAAVPPHSTNHRQGAESEVVCLSFPLPLLTRAQRTLPLF